MDTLKKSLCLFVSLLLVPIPMSFATNPVPAPPPSPTSTITICYVNPSDPRNETTLQIATNSVLAYLEQGSFLGSCSTPDNTGNTQICFVPANDPINAYTTTVSNKRLQAYLLYGSFMGPCSKNNDSHKITICHLPPGNPGNSQTIDIDRSALYTHMNQHGDFVGPCPPKDNDSCRDDNNYKICHSPNDNGGTTIWVKACRLLMHLKHGDYMGSCLESAPTPAPETPAPTTGTPATPTPTVIIESNITICHIPDGAPQNAYRMSIPMSSLLAYLLEGDTLGSCPENSFQCGDGIVNGEEQCDTIGESATCNADCTRPICGDRITNLFAKELCDAGATLNNTYCLTDCTWARCGDGYPRPGIEDCDTKGFSATCNNDCTWSRCGDGILNPQANEKCDDGNMLPGDGCSPTCQLETSCGNGILEGCEQCDMGADNGWNKFCLPNCKKATCKDGHVFAGFEECDDGNSDNTDSCLNNCRNATCGDSIIQIGVEQCDRGLNNNTGYCLNNCWLNTCGDGYIRTDTEECDLGKLNNNSGFCTKSCHRNRCGDGFIYIGEEECDTGLLTLTGSCLPGCRKAKCGDGYVQAGVENCDQGVLNGNGPGYCKMDCSGVQESEWPHSKIIGVALGTFFGAAMVTTIGVLAWKYSALKNAAQWYVNKATTQNAPK